jgi:hypothetical protein
MSFDPPEGESYWKRHFDDLNRIRLEDQLKKFGKPNNIIYTNSFVNKLPEKQRLIRTSVTPNERMVIGIKKELIAYKKMLQEEKQLNDVLRSELIRHEDANRYYKTQITIIRKQLNKLK